MPTAAEIRAHYDSLAFVYRAFWGDHIHHGLFDDNESPAQAQVRLIEHCVALLAKPARDVLDVGCGHGATAVRLAQHLGCRVTGITISEKQAQLARENAVRAGMQDRVTILTGDAESSFEYPLECYDVVWTMESSEHFADKWNYFRNVGRTLRPGGRLLLAAWTGSMNRRSVRGVARAYLCPELWTVEEYRAAIQAAGMQVQACEDLSRRVARTWEICHQRAKMAGGAVKLLPRAAREFVACAELMLEAYQSGELRYTVMVGEKRTPGAYKAPRE